MCTGVDRIMKNAILYTAPKTFTLTQVPVPIPQGTEILMRVRACGVCRTDLHIHEGHFFSAFPLIPGHEFAGEVVAVGEAVTRVVVGDRVTADNERQCGTCSACRRGEPLFCEHLLAQGVNAPGGLAEYVLVDERQVYLLAPHIPIVVGAMAEPTACAVHGMDVIRPRMGDDILLFGAGPTGNILAQLLRHGGAANLVVVDLSEKKLELAERLAQARPFLATPDNAHIAEIDATYPDSFDIVIDATGVPRIQEMLPHFTRNGGKVVFYGVAPEDARISITPYEVFRRQLTILGSFSQALTFERAVKLLNTGVVRTENLITHLFTLDRWGDALQIAREGRTDAVKIIMTP